MFVEDVALLLREWVNERNTGGPLTVAQLAVYLETGYYKYLSKIRSYNKDWGVSTVDITLTGTNTFDLAAAASAVRIMGNPAGGLTHGRLEKLRRIIPLSASGEEGLYLIGVTNQEALSLRELEDRPRYMLRNTTLIFDRNFTSQQFRLVYLAEQSIDWTQQTAGNNEYIDNWNRFHDLIAAYAARSWAVRDGTSPDIEAYIASREQDLNAFFSEGIDELAGSRVNEVYDF